MRILSTTLTNAQKAGHFLPLWKIVLSRTGQTTRGYEQSRIIDIDHKETADSGEATIILQNSDNALTTLDFEHYQMVVFYGFRTAVARTAWAATTAYALDDVAIPVTANGYQYRCSVAGTSAGTAPTWPTDLGVTVTDGTVTWEMDGNEGDEYSRTAPLRVRAQELYSGMGLLKCHLRAIGIPNQMGEDAATGEYEQSTGDSQTVKTLINKIADQTLSAYAGYSVITFTYDNEDSVIDTFKPQEYFHVGLNDGRWAKIKELLEYTKCKPRAQNDGNIHIILPTISGTTYDYEYKFNVTDEHNFFAKSVRNRFVNPNQETVKSQDFTGTATSATSFALAPKTHTTWARIKSTAEANLIAAAIIERYELDAERGFLTVPMNVGQEIWDYIKVTDSRSDDTRTGNVQYIQRLVHIPLGDNSPMQFQMRIAFGKVDVAAFAANIQAAGGVTANLAANMSTMLDNLNWIISFIRWYGDLIGNLQKRVYNLENEDLPGLVHSPALDDISRSFDAGDLTTKSPALDAPTKSWS